MGHPGGRSAPRRHDRTLLLVIAGLPESTGSSDLDRIVALAERGRVAGLHLVVAGWPVVGRPPLPQATLGAAAQLVRAGR